MRDFMRSKIAAAEIDFVVAEGTPQQKLPTLQFFARHIQKRVWWGKQPGAKKLAPVTVEWGTGCIPYLPRSTIYVDTGRETSLHVLHGMAHLLVNANRTQSSPTTDHDVEFVQMYLELVRRFYFGQVNDDVKRRFKKLLIAHGVKTKTVTDATRQRQRVASVINRTPTKEQLLETLKGLSVRKDSDVVEET